jgi:hypothetical protein
MLRSTPDVSWPACAPEDVNRRFTRIESTHGKQFVPVVATETSGPTHTRDASAVFDMLPPNTPASTQQCDLSLLLKNFEIGRLRLQSNATSRKSIRPPRSLPRPRKWRTRESVGSLCVLCALWRQKKRPSSLNSAAKQESADDALS